MPEETKKGLVIVAALVAVAFAVFMGLNAVQSAEPPEQVVGTLEDFEKQNNAEATSTTPNPTVSPDGTAIPGDSKQ
jgi:hypothetical protein